MYLCIYLFMYLCIYVCIYLFIYLFNYLLFINLLGKLGNRCKDLQLTIGCPPRHQAWSIGFQILINDAAVEAESEYWKYVDDLTFAENIGIMQGHLQDDLYEFSKWSSSYGLNLNAKKNIKPLRLISVEPHHIMLTWKSDLTSSIMLIKPKYWDSGSKMTWNGRPRWMLCSKKQANPFSYLDLWKGLALIRMNSRLFTRAMSDR